MLNLFPIQFLALLAYFILRVFAGVIIMWLGIQILNQPQKFQTTNYRGLVVFGVLEILIGVQLIVGIYTQAAALLGIILAVSMIWYKARHPILLIPDKTFWLLFIGVMISLFITGAGVFAFDLPI